MSSSNKRPLLKISTRKRKRPRGMKRPCNNDITSAQSGIPSILSRIPIPKTERSSPSQEQILAQSEQKKEHEFAFADNEISASLDLELPSDIIIAIQSLKQRYSFATCELQNVHLGKEALKFVLKPILNATLMTSSGNSETDKVASAIASTGFDVEIKRLCTSGKIKLIQLHGTDNGEEDVAVFEMEEYTRGIEDAKLTLGEIGAETGTGYVFLNQKQKIIDLFLSCIKGFHGTFVLGQELQSAMIEKNRCRSNQNYVFNENEWIQSLISCQLLLPRRLMTGSSTSSKAHASYWFTLPKLGHAASLITEGRRRMTLKLKRAPNREMKRTSLEIYARGGMAGPFHVRDLLASGVAKLRNTANGNFIKLLDD